MINANYVKIRSHPCAGQHDQHIWSIGAPMRDEQHCNRNQVNNIDDISHNQHDDSDHKYIEAQN
jgi:hypothetical protein